MKRRRMAFFPLILLAVCTVSLIHTNSVAPTYAALPAQWQTPTAVSALKAEADLLEKKALASHRGGDSSDALKTFDQAIELYRRAGDRKGEGRSFNNIGVVYNTLGKYPQALESYQQALAIRREVGDREGEAKTISNIGAIYHNLGQYQKALEFFQQALMIGREVGDLEGQETTLSNTGMAYQKLGRDLEALGSYQQALAIGWKLRDYARVVASFDNIAGVYRSLGQPSKAVESYQQVLIIQRVLSDRKGQGVTLNAIGKVYYDLEQYVKALEFFQQALVIQRAAGDRAGEAVTLNNIGTSHFSLDQYAIALEAHQQALALRRAMADRAGEGRTLSEVGRVYQGLGQYSRALELYQQSLEILRAVPDHRYEGRILNNIGEIYRYQGQYTKALDYYEQALAVLHAADDNENDGAILNNEGLAYVGLGQYEKALEFYNQALGIRRKRNDRKGEAINLNNIGGAYHSLGQFSKALGFYQQALAIRREVGDRVGEAATLHNIGGIYYRLAQYTKALEYYQQSLAIVREVGDRADEGVILNSIGLVYQGSGQYFQALEFYQRALAMVREVGDQAGEGKTLDNIGFAYESQGELKQALHFYQQSIEAQENIRSSARIEEFKISLAEQSVDVYQRATLLCMRLDQPAQAFGLSEAARARTFLDQIGNTRLDIRKGASPQLVRQEQTLQQELDALERDLRQEYSKPSPQKSDKKIGDLFNLLATKKQEYEELLTSLKQANPEYASLRSIDPLPLGEAQKLLDKDTTLLAYFVSGDKILAFVVTRDLFQPVEVPVSRKNLDKEIRWFRAFPSLSDLPMPGLQQLYTWLISPVKAYLKTPVVGIIPHGVLHYLPFTALMNGQQYLGDEHKLFYLPSASALRFIQQKRKSEGNRPLVLALAYDQPKESERLPHAKAEAQAIATLYGTQALVGNAATESAFRARAGNFNILHLAAHGQLDSDHPLFSRIILAPDKPDKDADGYLEVQEVYGLDLARANLVVLSACQTQLGAQSRGDDIVGLNRAFIYAGAPSVIASLWRVDDEATGILMKSFYTHLKRGVSKAAALQLAQRETRAKYPHPYYWAAFVLTGDPGTTTASSSGHTR